jgi:hypothetical protein
MPSPKPPPTPAGQEMRLTQQVPGTAAKHKRIIDTLGTGRQALGDEEDDDSEQPS